jgi:hypothetical protein
MAITTIRWPLAIALPLCSAKKGATGPQDAIFSCRTNSLNVIFLSVFPRTRDHLQAFSNQLLSSAISGSASGSMISFSRLGGHGASTCWILSCAWLMRWLVHSLEMRWHVSRMVVAGERCTTVILSDELVLSCRGMVMCVRVRGICA